MSGQSMKQEMREVLKEREEQVFQMCERFEDKEKDTREVIQDRLKEEGDGLLETVLLVGAVGRLKQVGVDEVKDNTYTEKVYERIEERLEQSGQEGRTWKGGCRVD